MHGDNQSSLLNHLYIDNILLYSMLDQSPIRIISICADFHEFPNVQTLKKCGQVSAQEDPKPTSSHGHTKIIIIYT